LSNSELAERNKTGHISEGKKEKERGRMIKGGYGLKRDGYSVKLGLDSLKGEKWDAPSREGGK